MLPRFQLWMTQSMVCKCRFLIFRNNWQNLEQMRKKLQVQRCEVLLAVKLCRLSRGWWTTNLQRARANNLTIGRKPNYGFLTVVGFSFLISDGTGVSAATFSRTSCTCFVMSLNSS